MTSNIWRYMFGAAGILALVNNAVLILFFRYETPKYNLFVLND
jgi:hypothetical protein